MIEFGTPAFLVALLQIIGINIVLSGDNAVVIALAARSLPAVQQQKAVFWGSAAAVVMRIILTIVAVELLRLPVLKLIGAGLLLWIAVQLLVPADEGEGEGVANSNMMAAIRTILIADLVMSLDNVIGVAAAAKGSVLLLTLGLAISIPLVVFASTFLLKVMERFPIIITAGAALLGHVAGDMAASDPIAAPWITANAEWLRGAFPAVGVVIVLALGKWLALRAEARDEARPLVEIEEGIEAKIADSKGQVHKLLLPIDGSDLSLRAVDRVLGMRDGYMGPVMIHLLNVQHALHKDVSQFVSHEDMVSYFREEGLKELAAARARLGRAGIVYQHHSVIGDQPARAIAHFAREHGITEIIMCSHCRPAVEEFFVGSVAKDVSQASKVPVTLVS